MRSLALISAVLSLGCSAAGSAATVTFYREVAPILQRHCQSCHRAGEAAPMSFESYTQVRPWAKAIKQAVVTRRMPPWFADPALGHFRNARRLSEQEIATLQAWVDGGAAAGDPADAPPAVAYTPGWGIGPPDVVLEMPAPVTIPAAGKIDYQYVIVPTGFTEDRWVRAVEARPGNRALTHHVIAFVRPLGSRFARSMPPGRVFTLDELPPEERGGMSSAEWLVGYAPGVPPEIYPEDQAKFIPAGSDLILQLHYTANGQAGQDQSKIGLVFAPTAPRERVVTIPAQTTRFVIPPGAEHHEVRFRFTFHGDAKLLAMAPHMHARGKGMTVRLMPPEGDPVELLQMRWDFNWQLFYELADPLLVRAGSRLEAVAIFDNSANNPFNPDPSAEVRWGEQTWEEMAMCILSVAVDARRDPRELLRPLHRPASTTAAGVPE